METIEPLGDVALIEEDHHWGAGFEGSEPALLPALPALPVWCTATRQPAVMPSRKASRKASGTVSKNKFSSPTYHSNRKVTDTCGFQGFAFVANY